MRVLASLTVLYMFALRQRHNDQTPKMVSKYSHFVQGGSRYFSDAFARFANCELRKHSLLIALTWNAL